MCFLCSFIALSWASRASRDFYNFIQLTVINFSSLNFFSVFLFVLSWRVRQEQASKASKVATYNIWVELMMIIIMASLKTEERRKSFWSIFSIHKTFRALLHSGELFIELSWERRRTRERMAFPSLEPAAR